MPTYRYKCQCGNHFVVTKKMSEYQSKEPCEACGQDAERTTEDLVAGDYIVKCDGFYGKTSK